MDLAGTQGKSDKELLDLLKQNGTQSYKATIKVYGAKDGKPDLTNLVATKDLTVNLNGLTTPNQVKDSVANNIKIALMFQLATLIRLRFLDLSWPASTKLFHTKLLVEMVC